MTRTELATLPDSGLHIAWREGVPEGKGAAFVLLHGLSGDERSLWVFEPALPRQAAVLAVRGIHTWPRGGFSWIAPEVDRRYTAQDFSPGMDAVCAAVEARLPRAADGQGLVLVGFSQGSGLAFALAAENRLKVAGVVCLCGFLPEGPARIRSGMPVYWSHGLRDTLVPIDEARSDVLRLRQAGAKVTFCESDTGHKVGRECVRALRAWLSEAGLA